MQPSRLPSSLLALVCLAACGLLPADEDDDMVAETGASTMDVDPGTSGAGESSAADSEGSSGAADTTGDADESSESGDTTEGPVVVDAPSCDGLETQCAGESCCTTIVTSGGSVDLGRSDSGNDSCPLNGLCMDRELPEHEVQISGFSLDKYPVTVGRMRQFVAAWENNWRPSPGDGAHPNAPQSGWDDSWSDLLPGDLRGSLACSGWATWTDEPDFYEDRPASCLTWYQAQAFCIWDGGRLPTEAEYEFIAAGGDQNRLYAWGGAPPDETRAVFDEVGDYEVGAVGSKPDGAGRWGHADLAGNMATWTFDCYAEDYYSTPMASEPDPFNSPVAGDEPCPGLSVFVDPHVVRGVGADNPDLLRAAMRDFQSAGDSYASVGVRCARD